LVEKFTHTKYELIFTSIICVRENMQWVLKAVKGNETLVVHHDKVDG
jgi:hypothetical protein